MFCLSAQYKFLVQCFHNLDSKDLGSWDLGMNNDRKPNLPAAVQFKIAESLEKSRLSSMLVESLENESRSMLVVWKRVGKVVWKRVVE